MKKLLPCILLLFFACSEPAVEYKTHNIITTDTTTAAERKAEVEAHVKNFKETNSNITTTVNGDSADELTISAPEINEVWNKQFENSGLLEAWFKNGFKKITLSGANYKAVHTPE